MLTHLGASAYPDQVNYCEYVSPDSKPSDAVLAANALINATPYAVSYGLTFIPSSGYVSEGSAVLLKVGAEGTYQSASGTPSAICNPGDICYIEFGYPSGQGCYYGPPITPSTVSTPGYYTGSNFEACPDVSANAGGTASPATPCLLYSSGISYLSTYQNQANETYTQPLSTQYLQTGNYVICAYDYQQIPVGSQTETISPFFATLALNCSNGYCSVNPTLQQLPQIPCPTCKTTGTPGNVFAYNSLNASAFGQAVCGIYGTLSAVLLIFALMLMLLGAVIYAGSSLLPAQTRGMAQSYAFGFVFVGVISAVISSLSIYALSIAGNTTVTGVLALCA
jgi:hypothetical protein